MKINSGRNGRVLWDVSVGRCYASACQWLCFDHVVSSTWLASRMVLDHPSFNITVNLIALLYSVFLQFLLCDSLQ